LVLEVEGRRIGSVELDGSHLVKDCASASVQIVQRLLTTEEIVDSEESDADDYISKSLRSESSEEIRTAATKGAPRPVARDGSSTRDITEVPSYVKKVSFHVSPQDLNSKRAEDLKARFPDVSILTGPVLINRATTDTPEPVPSSTNNMAGTNLAIAGPDPTTSGDARNSPISEVADRIGLRLTTSLKAMWKHWTNYREILPLTATSQASLNKLYRKLVTLYVLAYHKGESGLCYALLLRFQSTNFSDRDDLPELTTAVLAFEFLPESDPLCQWIATLFAFLWQTRLYESREEVLKMFNQVNSDAFCKFIFAVAWVRDPHTKGHNTAVLDQWCEVHDHENGSAEEASCKMVRNRLKEHLESIREQEAKDEYKESKRLVNDYEKAHGGHHLGKPAVQGTPISSKKKDSKSSAGPRKRKRG
jgi:hypothetical protein